MPYEKKIEVYKVKENFNSPLASNPSKVASCTIGDFVIIIDDEVWVRDWNAQREEQFAMAIYTPEFVRINPFIFEQQ